MSVFSMKIVAVAKCQKNFMHLLQWQRVNIFLVVRRMDDNFMKVGNRILVGKNPYLPNRLIWRTRTNSVKFFARNLLITRTKDTNLVYVNILCGCGVTWTLLAPFGNNNPSICRYIRDKLSHTLVNC